MAPRPLILLFLALFAAPAAAGYWETSGKGLTQPGPKVQVSGLIRSYVLTNKAGHKVVVTPRQPLLLGDRLPLPPGPWAELTLRLDGPATLTYAGVTRELDLDGLVIPIEDPDATSLQLDWQIDPGAWAEPSDRLRLALQDGALARP